MWLPAKEVLSATETDRQSLLIVQAWRELLSSAVTDSFRARVLDAPLLIEELSRVVDLARYDERWVSHVVAICEELEDERANLLSLVDGQRVDGALSAVTRYRGGNADLPLLAERLRVLKSLVGDYQARIVGEALRLAGDTKRKSDLLARLSALATHIQKQGLAEESLAALDDSLLSKNPLEVVEALSAPLGMAERDFSCFLAVNAPEGMASSVFADTEFRQVGRKRFESSEHAVKWYELHAEHYLVELNVRAMSRRLAAELALARIHTLLNLVVFYENKSEHAVSPSVLVEHDHRYLAVEVTPSKHFGMLPRRGSISVARKRFNGMRAHLDGRLSNILESNALGIAADDPRTAVIHLWTALEAIAGSYGASSIGERVASAVGPIVAWRRVDKIVTYLALGTRRLAEHQGRDFDRTHMPNSHRAHVDRTDLLACLAGESRNPGIMAVFASCGVSPLLCHQMLAAWEEFNDPKKVKNRMRRSERRIRWQILRLYRARNLLVHRGERDDLVWRLLENAQYYVTTVIGRVVHDLADQREWTVDTSIEHQRQKYEQVIDRLERKAAGGVTFDELLVRVPESRKGQPIWPPASNGEPVIADADPAAC